MHGIYTKLLVCQQVSADAPRVVLTAIVKLSGMFICDSKNVIFQQTEESFLMLCPSQNVRVHNPSSILVITLREGESLPNRKFGSSLRLERWISRIFFPDSLKEYR